MLDHHSNKQFYAKKSNEQRLKSLEQYERERQTKKHVIRNSIHQSAHIQFESDDEYNHPKNEQSVKTTRFQKKNMQLFTNDDDTIDIDKHFNETNNTNKKQQVNRLQTQLLTTNDPRFQLSEQFLDEINDDENERSFEDERKHSLAILDQITNRNSTTKSNQSKTKMIRFDPNKIEHRIYEIAGNQQKKSSIKPISNETQSTSTVPIVDEKRTYEFDRSKFQSMFKNHQSTEQNGTFQFQFFNSHQAVHAAASKIDEPSKMIVNERPKVFTGKRDETSSDDDDNEQNQSTITDEQDVNSNQTFFFFDIDQRLKDGLQCFVRTDDFNVLERTWPTKRKEIAQALRTKHRKAIQRKDKQRIVNNRRRQTQHASKSQTS